MSPCTHLLLLKLPLQPAHTVVLQQSARTLHTGGGRPNA